MKLRIESDGTMEGTVVLDDTGTKHLHVYSVTVGRNGPELVTTHPELLNDVDEIVIRGPVKLVPHPDSNRIRAAFEAYEQKVAS